MSQLDVQLKPLPVLVPGQSFICKLGCGVTTPRVDQFEYSREETLAGELISSKNCPVWRSACCGSEVLVYSEPSGDTVPLGA